MKNNCCEYRHKANEEHDGFVCDCPCHTKPVEAAREHAEMFCGCDCPKIIKGRPDFLIDGCKCECHPASKTSEGWEKRFLDLISTEFVLKDGLLQVPPQNLKKIVEFITKEKEAERGRVREAVVKLLPDLEVPNYHAGFNHARVLFLRILSRQIPD